MKSFTLFSALTIFITIFFLFSILLIRASYLLYKVIEQTSNDFMRWEKLEITHLTPRKFPYVPLAIFCLFRLLLPFFRLCEIYITTPSKVFVSFLVNLNFTW